MNGLSVLRDYIRHDKTVSLSQEQTQELWDACQQDSDRIGDLVQLEVKRKNEIIRVTNDLQGAVNSLRILL